jgi:aspartyl-tRNA(Asn)/glutamyl-tRNA(Gln) amidotransferase subunit A
VFTAFANMAACPAISLPCGLSLSGLPIGFKLVGAIGQDETILSAAAQYEARHAGSRFRFPSL